MSRIEDLEKTKKELKEKIKKKNLETKKPEEGNMGLEDKDLQKIGAMIGQAVKEARGVLTKETAATLVTVLKNHKEAEKKETEDKEKERKKTELATLTKTFCEQFPGLCKRMDGLEKTVKEIAGKPEGKEKEPTHATAKDYLDCPECSKALLNTIARTSKENDSIPKRIADVFKKEGSLDILKGAIATVEKPPETKKKEGEHEEGKPEEGAKEEKREGLF